MNWFRSSFQCLWTGYSENREHQYERILINKWGGIPEANVKIDNVTISPAEDDKIHYISIVAGGKPPYVFIPGYGASGAIYYKLMKEISEKYDM